MSPRIASFDNFFFQLTVVLFISGIAFISSASWHEAMRYSDNPWMLVSKHLVVALLAFPVMLALSSLHYKWWQSKLAWVFFFVILVLLGLTATKLGIVTGGSRRWLSLGPLQLQASEFAKIAAAVLLAKVFAEKHMRIFALALVAVALFLVLKQPDLGTTIIIASTVGLAAYASGFNFFAFLMVIGGGAWFAVSNIINTPYQMQRVQYWLDPYSDPLGHGYNLIQSQNAIGAGGIFGVGFGSSLQKLGALPIPHADFIFSVICEELGFLGAFVLLALLATWVLRALHISYFAPDNFSRILGFCLSALIAAQILINIGVATGLFPITGMTLPFISYGGSSLMSTCIASGILLNISRFKREVSQVA